MDCPTFVSLPDTTCYAVADSFFRVGERINQFVNSYTNIYWLTLWEPLSSLPGVGSLIWGAWGQVYRLWILDYDLNLTIVMLQEIYVQ
jgi:hypothetical protein